jgi:UDP-glucuronate 4-epimerase
LKILITGAAGFIGYHVAKKLIAKGETVVGIDNLNNYYSPQLKEDRLKNLGLSKDGNGNTQLAAFFKIDLKDAIAVNQLFTEHQFDCVIHLAAQAGVRYSLKHPQAYVDSNITGFLNILEACRHHPVKHLIFASSSSVYGLNQRFLTVKSTPLIILPPCMRPQRNRMR